MSGVMHLGMLISAGSYAGASAHRRKQETCEHLSNHNSRTRGGRSSPDASKDCEEGTVQTLSVASQVTERRQVGCVGMFYLHRTWRIQGAPCATDRALDTISSADHFCMSSVPVVHLVVKSRQPLFPPYFTLNSRYA